MGESATRSELGQVLDAIKSTQFDIKAMQGDIQAMQGDIKAIQGDIQAIKGDIQSMQSDIQAIDKKLDIHIATTAEKFNTLQVEIKAVDDKVTDLGDRQKIVDSRLWGFIVALVGAILAYLVKLSFFDKV